MTGGLNRRKARELAEVSTTAFGIKVLEERFSGKFRRMADNVKFRPIAG
jgi:hypothetical protein